MGNANRGGNGETTNAPRLANGRPARRLLLDNVVKTYGPIRAVNRLSASRAPRRAEFIALLGA